MLKWYKDSLGKLTGGYGHLQLPGEEKLVVTQALADEWYEDDIAAAKAAAKVQVNQLVWHIANFIIMFWQAAI